MKIRQTIEFETACQGCGTLIRYDLGEVRFEGRDDQRIPCPVCGRRILVVQGGAMAPGVVAKTHERTWRAVTGAYQKTDGPD